MIPRKVNADVFRSLLKQAERRVVETLAALESNDMDDVAVEARLAEMEKEFRRLAKAA